MVRNEKDNTDELAPNFTVTNFTQDLIFSGTESSASAIASFLATVINQLQKQGILNATVSAP